MDRFGITVNALYRKAKGTIIDLNKSFSHTTRRYEEDAATILQRFLPKSEFGSGYHAIFYDIIDHRGRKIFVDRDNVTIMGDDKSFTIADVVTKLALSQSIQEHVTYLLTESNQYGSIYLPCIDYKEIMPYVAAPFGRISRIKFVFPPQSSDIKWAIMKNTSSSHSGSCMFNRSPSNPEVFKPTQSENEPLQSSSCQHLDESRCKGESESGNKSDSNLLLEDSLQTESEQFSQNNARAIGQSELVDEDLKLKLSKWCMKDGHSKDIRTLLATVETVAPDYVEWKSLTLSEIMANPAALKRHYRNAILTFHPDRHQSANVADKYRVERIFHAIHNSYKKERE